MVLNEKAIVPLDIEPPAKPEPKPVEIAQVEARTISKFAEASMAEYSEAERAILFAPVNVTDIKVRPDGQIYLEWAWYANRLDKAFGQGRWAIEPAPWNPRLSLMGNITYREYVLWIRGQYAGTAVGHHEEQRKTANFGDAAEATRQNALTRCCKHMGMARELWTKDCIEAFKLQMKKQSSLGSGTDKGKGEAATIGTNVSLQRNEVVIESGPPSNPSPYEHCKEMIGKAENMAELQVLWKFFNNQKSKMTDAQAKELSAMKDEKKKELELRAEVGM